MSGASPAAEEVAKSAVPLGDLSLLDEAIREGTPQAIKEALRFVRPADIGRDLSRRSLKDSKAIIESADDRRAAAMLRAAHPAVAGQLLEYLGHDHAARSLRFLPTEHQVMILGTVRPELRKTLEELVDKEEKIELERMLAHPPHAVARLMTPWIWTCDRGCMVADALKTLREHNDEIEIASNCYVVQKKKLVGVLALRELVVADPTTPIDELMTRNPIAVSEDTPRGDAADIVRSHEFLSLPVLDKDQNLVGAVRVDDLLDVVLDKVGTGLLNQGAVSGKVAAQLPYFKTSLWRVVRSRLTWLVLLFVAETATGYVLRHFEGELAKVVALSFFIPLLIGTGGNAGSQTVSTVIRALALGEVRLSDVVRVLFKEVSAGIVLGILLGLIAFGRALLWGVGIDIAACVGVTVLAVCTWANTVGALIPIAAQKVGIDPTVVSGPLITTLVDASGLFLYLTIAKLMISTLAG